MLRWLPENISTFGGDIDFLFRVIYYLTFVIFLGVFITMVAFLVLYRRRAGRAASYTHGNTTLEVIWTVIPALIVLALGVKSKAAWDHIKRDLPESRHHYRVTARQFNWMVTYPGADGQFGTADDFTLENDLNVPANAPVRIALNSEDVIHSFFVPTLRLKQDALPGTEINLWFEATKPGKYEIACAELCGFGHYNMRAALTVHAPADYDAWLKQHKS